MAIENGWRDCTVGELAASQKNALVGGPFGSNLVSRDYTPSGVPVIRGKNLSVGKWVGGEFAFVSDGKADSLSANLARPGDLIFTQRGNAVLNGGQVAIVPEGEAERYVVSQSQMKLTVNRDKVDSRFLYFVFRSPDHELYLRNNAIVTGVPHTNLGLLRDYPLRLPPLDEQKAIAGILGVLDDNIELNRQMNETLEAMARAIFKSWFVDFDPVRAKLDGRQPTGMDADTAALFPDRFEHTELGLLPSGWNVEPLCHIADVVMGTSPSSTTYNEEGVGVPLVNGPVEFGSHFPVKKKWTTAPTRFSKPKDLIFCVRGSTTGRRVVSDDEYCLGRGVCAIRAKSQQQAFVNKSIDAELRRLLSRATGSVFPSLSGPLMKGFELVIAANPVIDKYCSLVEPMDDQVSANVRQSQTLGRIRDALLPKLLSGEIRVSDAESSIEGVA